MVDHELVSRCPFWHCAEGPAAANGYDDNDDDAESGVDDDQKEGLLSDHPNNTYLPMRSDEGFFWSQREMLSVSDWTLCAPAKGFRGCDVAMPMNTYLPT